MPLTTILAVNVSASVASLLLRILLAKDGVVREVSSSVVDIVKTLSLDAFQQKDAEILITGIGTKIAKSLLPVVESDGNRLDEDAKESLVLLLHEVLSSSEISAEALVAMRLNPRRMEEHLLEKAKSGSRDLSEQELSAFQRIVRECSFAIVNAASTLPSFTEHAIAKLLADSAFIPQILTNTDKALDELAAIRRESFRANSDAEAAQFELEYRNCVVAILDQVELFGVKSSASRRYNLSIAYVSLSLEPERKRGSKRSRAGRFDAYGGRSLEEMLNVPGVSEDDSRIVGSSKQLRTSIEDILAESKRILVRGIAGSGKTTLLQWIAVQAIRGLFLGPIAHLNGRLPLLIQLRRCVKQNATGTTLTLPTIAQMSTIIAPHLASETPPNWVIDKLRSGTAIVMIDGVDEVDNRHHRAIQDWVRGLGTSYPDCVFIVTARTHISDDWLKREGFISAEIQRMQWSDIKAFVEHWYDAAKREAVSETERRELPVLANSLILLLRRKPTIRKLATLPLLCSMLCALYREGRHLPDDQIRLYGDCIYTLVEHRETDAQIILTEYPALNSNQKLILLADLAFNFIKNEWSQVRQDIAEGWVEKKLHSLTDKPANCTAGATLSLLVHRSGIIRIPIDGEIEFIHKSFQEFLAAKAALGENAIGMLINNAMDNSWSNVTILAAGLAQKPIREELILGLMSRATNSRRTETSLHYGVLAAACLENVEVIDPRITQKIKEFLANVLPPDNKGAARVIAKAGSFAIPYLKHGQTDEQVAIACVRALSLIGSDEALEAIASYYAGDSRQVVIDELIRCWDLFDRDKYAREVLQKTTSLKRDLEYPLSIKLTDLRPLTGLKTLEVGSTAYPVKDNDFSALSVLTKLTDIKIRGNGQTFDLAALSSLGNLKTLRATGFTSMQNMDGLKALTRLNILHLSCCRFVADLTPLSALTSLTSLAIFYNDRCTSVESLGSLVNLLDLSLVGIRNLTDVGVVRSFNQLRSLNLTLCGLVDDIRCLDGLANLKSVDVRGCARKIMITRRMRSHGLEIRADYDQVVTSK